MILAGDVGGTKTVLTLMDKNDSGEWLSQREETFASQDFANFEDILDSFLPAKTQLDSVCFGVAGPVVDQLSRITNLPWVLDGAKLRQKLSAGRVKLLNDLEAMAIGMLHLPADELLELNPDAQQQTGNIAVIAAGTGLGEAILYWDGEKHQPMATEGGHSDFAAQNPEQDDLLRYLRTLYPNHVSYERIVSGIGFSHLYDFFCAQGYHPCPAVPDVDDPYNGIDRNAVISKLGLNGENSTCAEAVRLFVELYGAEAGNLALKSLAIGGVYVGGGIAEKILPAMKTGRFIGAFKAKGRFTTLLDTVSVKVSLNPRTPLLGAMNYFIAE